MDLTELALEAVAVCDARAFERALEQRVMVEGKDVDGSQRRIGDAVDDRLEACELRRALGAEHDCDDVGDVRGREVRELPQLRPVTARELPRELVQLRGERSVLAFPEQAVGDLPSLVLDVLVVDGARDPDS